MQDRTHDGKAFRIFNVIDEYTRECLVGHVPLPERGIKLLDGRHCKLRRGLPIRESKHGRYNRKLWIG